MYIGDDFAGETPYVRWHYCQRPWAPMGSTRLQEGHGYSETGLTEGSAMRLFRDLGWETKNVQMGEAIGIGGT
jgi:hypothetical protein